MHDVPQDTGARLTEAAARAAEATPGVAFLRPDLPGLPRQAAARGVRVRRTATADGERVHVELRMAVHRGHRAADVARAARTAVEQAVTGCLPGASVDVTVTVTALV